MTVVAGKIPGLPFADATFDGVTGTFVISHVPRYRAALVDMVRVLRPGGKLGVTAWGKGECEYRNVWQAIAAQFVRENELRARLRQLLPWEDWFSEPHHMETALREIGLENVEMQYRKYKLSGSVDEFLAVTDIGLRAKVIRDLLGPTRWASFREKVMTELHRCWRGVVQDTQNAYFAFGTKRTGGADFTVRSSAH